MPQQIIISEQLRIAALLTDERVDELIVAQGSYQIGDVFLGTVENVLPGIDAAFVNIGESEKNGFIHVTDLGPIRLKKGAVGITELLEPRQKVLVQVMKEPTGTKGPRLTGNLALPGRYLVLQPHGQGVNISRRINAEAERNRLRALGVLIKPPGSGLLIRTEANEINEDLLIDDLECLMKQWEAIELAAEKTSPPALLNRDEDFVQRILRDHVSQKVSRLILEDKTTADRASEFLGKDAQNIVIESHIDNIDLLEHYKINSAIINALKPRVDLPSGGYIIIEPTEALTVIDVNSGSFTRSSNARETVLWTNCEAAIEIARQLKLRNIGGVIIIDFIDMESRKDQLQLLEHFTSAIQDDSARPQIAQLTELGLVELTRKRQGQNIYELFGKSCINCAGLGHVAVLPGKDLLQPLANASGLVRSQVSFKADNHFSTDSNGKKKRPGKYKGNSESAEVTNEITGNSNEISSLQNENDMPEEISNQLKDQEILCVEMKEEEEKVFSWLGLSPILLLEPVPEIENLIVRITHPGEDKEKVLEEAKNQISSSHTRRRKKNRPGTRSINRVSTETNADNDEDDMIKDTSAINKEELTVEITPIEDGMKHEVNDVAINFEPNIGNTIENSVEKSVENNVENSLIEENENDEPRRRRRRSSAQVNDD